ncbi:MAG: SPASM domain-containing protein [Atopobiaceae bacterium]|nr:SPASM domain-containing protein [Atopobiaceae bacterium]
MATDVIESLSPRLIAVAEKRGCAYDAWIFTNGYLLSQEVVDLLGRCRIGHVHIPLDGIRENNDAMRRLVGGGPTFDRIVENLALLKPPIKTLIRGNTHKGNVAQLDELKELVTKRARETGNRLDFYAASLVDTSSRDDPNEQMAAYAFDGIEVSLRLEARHVPVGKDHSCVAQNLWMVAIDDEGYLYKCGGKLCGQPKFAYGTAHSWDPALPLATASNPDMLSRFLNTGTPEPGDACYECEWLPMCGGGCPQLRLFGKHKCPPYRAEPERLVLAIHARKHR